MKSFLSSRSRVTTPVAVPVAEPAAPLGFKSVSVPHPDSADHEEHHQGVPIECVREGDRIVRLKIRCACGDEIEIDCLYETGAS